ncbi:hypothetical protein CYLTODRAFT_226155 [Cylindrobasidium torrendii FP15055 ss-10]|uniref:Uncharacterized protein n=1 Tax=Cylindrobasidium torrendii FP15055 ss-10 TaxID=1314674 RepID=A0A0D7AU91_9AGAR|nr:hypothetical protein CYLTODRAFT_205222 [Cylindrobasidium torrendii FP15055 ss-10]KIY69456.1 hypothetical protein CYLTODRAFT_226155 [Cylindrobasidium torrendii FP15055 ss-10]
MTKGSESVCNPRPSSLDPPFFSLFSPLLLLPSQSPANLAPYPLKPGSSSEPQSSTRRPSSVRYFRLRCYCQR